MNRISLPVLMTIVISFAISTRAQNQRTLVERSNIQAREVLAASISAMGGQEELKKINDVTRELSGTRSDEGQGLMPVWPRVDQPPVLNHPTIKSIRDSRGRAYDELEDIIFGGQPIKLRNVVTSSTAFVVSDTSRNLRVLSQTGVINARAQRFRRYPENLLITAWSRPETLRLLGKGDFAGRRQHVVSFSDSDGAQVSMYFDTDSKFLTKTEMLNDDPVLGDTIVETVYSDWRPVQKVILPFRYVERIGGSTLQDLRASKILINTALSESLFAMPDGFAKFDLGQTGSSPKKLLEDVYVSLSSYNSVFVIFKDFVLAIEAGGSNRQSAAAITEIKKLFPDKPLKYVVSTHFHFDHLAGIRSYVAEGTTVVTTPSAKEVIECAVAASHQMRPDALARNPRSARIETVNEKRIFDDGVHRVELIKISSPHVREMIIVYLPKEKILFEADMLDLPEAGVPVSGNDTVDLAKQIEVLDLNVDTIIPAHGRIGTIADLRNAIALKVSSND